MKTFIFAIILAFASAKEFNYKPGNSTCILLDVKGEVNVVARSNGTQVGKPVNLDLESLDLDDANSNCQTIKLVNANKTVQVWFQTDSSSDQKVTPIAAVNTDIFPETTNSSVVTFAAPSFGPFMTNQTFECISELEHKFAVSGDNPTDLTFELTAKTTNLKVQFEGENYSGGFSSDVVECAGDKKNGSTPAPASSTTPKASTTPAATTTPLPPKDSVSVNVTNGNITCIRLEGQMTINVADGNATHALNVPQNAVASGNCSYNATIQKLDMKFEKDWALMFTFSKNKDGDVSITQIDLTYDTSIFDDSAVEATKTVSVQGDFLKSSSDGYYMCNANSTLLSQDSVTLTTTNLKYRAFNTDSDAKFSGSVMECSADEDTSSVVPIAVGAALAGLVVIVLIAYLIGRRRSRQTGYESV